jgi:hypothetical protein
MPVRLRKACHDLPERLITKLSRKLRSRPYAAKRKAKRDDDQKANAIGGFKQGEPSTVAHIWNSATRLDFL